MEKISEIVNDFREELRIRNVNPSQGLPKELFLFSSTLAPVINVDLIITDKSHHILLVWREDMHNGSGWHIPGCCIRFRETIEEAIIRCAKTELGCEVEILKNCLAIVQNIITEKRDIVCQDERAHFISLAYECHLTEKFVPVQGMKWFDGLPEDLIPTQENYRKHWNEIEERLKY